MFKRYLPLIFVLAVVVITVVAFLVLR